MKVTGTIIKITDVQEGTSGQGKEWKKVNFLLETTEEYNNLYFFEVFGAEKVDKFIQYNKIGALVDVDFNVKTNEYQGKYYTSLTAWKTFKADGNASVAQSADNEEVTDDLPF